jgi:glutathione S-transferase
MERVRLYEWLGFISSELHKAFAPFFHNEDEAHKSEGRKSIERRLTFVADQLRGREFLLGQRFSVADAYFYVMLRWCDMAGVDLVKFPKLGSSYRKRIASRAAVQAAVKAEGLPPGAAAEKQTEMAS